MYLHEILSDVRAWLALGIFCTGAVCGVLVSLIGFLIDRHFEREREDKNRK